MKRQDNIRLWHAPRNQAIGQPLFGAVVLDPDLPVFDIQVKKTAVDPVITSSTYTL